MADTEDLSCLNKLSTPVGNSGVNGVKVGETYAGDPDGNAELRLIAILNLKSQI